MRRRFTVKEYYAMAEAGILTENDRVELLNGEIIAMPPIGSWHAGHVNRFIRLLGVPLLQRAMISIQGQVRLSDDSEPEPDAMLLKPREDDYTGGHPGPEDVLLLIEVADTTVDYDRGAKLTAYARAGIREVWIVVRKERRIELYTEPSEGGYANVRRVVRGQRIAPKAFPDIVLEVDKVITE